MFADLRKAVNDGLLLLNDTELINEAKSFTRNDLMDRQPDPRDVTVGTRHFDLLTACAIALQLKDYAEVNEERNPFIEIPIGVEQTITNPAE